MAAELGESQLSSLLESVPGLANVLRSPVADAIVHMIRAGAGLGEFRIQDARELVQYATRRGLIPSSEGTELLEEVERSGNGYRQKAKATRGRGAVKKLAKSKAATGTRVGTAKTAKGKVKQTAKGSKKTAKKATKRVKSAGKVSKKKRR
jgi:hypothetical protein